MRWFTDAGVRSGALASVGVDCSIVGLGLLVFNAAGGLLLMVAGVVLTCCGLPSVLERQRAVRHTRQSSPAGAERSERMVLISPGRP